MDNEEEGGGEEGGMENIDTEGMRMTMKGRKNRRMKEKIL
jgi:hypothetical protein